MGCRVFLACFLAAALLSCTAVPEESASAEAPVYLSADEEFAALCDAAGAEYAGCCIGENGLVLRYCGSADGFTELLRQNGTGSCSVTDENGTVTRTFYLEEAAYTLDELNTAYSILSDHVSEAGVTSVSLSIRDNCIRVGITESADSDAVRETLSNLLTEHGAAPEICRITKSSAVYRY